MSWSVRLASPRLPKATKPAIIRRDRVNPKVTGLSGESVSPIARGSVRGRGSLLADPFSLTPLPKRIRLNGFVFFVLPKVERRKLSDAY